MSAITPMRTRRSLLRRAFTLVEILTSLAILGIIGLAFVRIVISQSRFTEGQMAMRNARTVSRNSMNILLTDLRMVQDNGGLRFAARDSVTVRVPVAFGLLCENQIGGATMSLLPVDPAITDYGLYSGWAYRDSTTGRFVYNDATTPKSFSLLDNGTTTVCTDSSIVLGVQRPGILPMTYKGHTGRVVRTADPLVITSTNPGWPVFLYQQITYKFATSTAYPGRIGLFRKVKTNDPNRPMVDEIIAPFDTSAKFRFYVLNSDLAQADVPADVNDVRGLELVLAGSSPRAQQGLKSAQQALVTGVFFKNRRDP
jgi:prepilin-type N-terminal cleavage/methylation domain-containing protein